MTASTYTRVGDFTDDEAANAGGRSTVDTATLDGELDAVQTVLDDHAADLDVLLRDDGQVQDDLLQGHEFSAAALAYLATILGTSSLSVVWRGTWAVTTDYAAGNLVEYNDSTFICLIAHNSDDYADFVTALAADAWDLFAASAAASVGTGSANEVLYYDGAGYSWGNVTAAMAPALAPKASPALTGTATAEALTASGAVTLNGPLRSGVYDYGTLTTALAVNFAQTYLQEAQVGASNITVTSANLAAGAMVEIRVTGAAADRTLTFPAGWTFLGFKPTNVLASSTAILTLRSFGTTDADVVASWSET